MKKILLTLAIAIPLFTFAQKKHRLDEGFVRWKTDTLYSFQPSYFQLVNNKTHKLEHYTTDSLLVMYTIGTKSYSNDGKNWYVKLYGEHDYSNPQRMYYYNYKRIYPVKVEKLTGDNVLYGSRYLLTLKHKISE